MEQLNGLGGGTPPTFTLPVTFIALFDPFTEVSGAIAALSAMISPELKDASIGGRIPERVTLNIGRRINIIDVAIQDISFDLDAPRWTAWAFPEKHRQPPVDRFFDI